jgi:S-adenosylmethionine:tRNA ribosyltransferase-isomerase
MNHLSISEYNYNLPDEKIAKYPLDQRDQSKLLVWNNGTITDDRFSNLPERLPSNTLLVFNNTRVIRARLLFQKETGAHIEIVVLDPIEPADYAQNFQQTKNCTWKCVVGNLKKWKTGKLVMPIEIEGTLVNFCAENINNSGSFCYIKFSWDNQRFSFSDLLEAAGNIPIPPYLHRNSEESDLTRYQTIYSKIKGSVAAPTAGLHFTNEVFGALKSKGFNIAETTLHVGAGTFQPVKSDSVNDHEMHTEHIVIDLSLLETLINHNGPIIAVGTTSIRTLESIYWMGCKIVSNPKINPNELTIDQWEPYSEREKPTKLESLRALLDYMTRNGFSQLNSATQIIIVPGYQFRVVDGMITNFHQPKSTLLLLISAFVGNEWKTIYTHALENDYRFLSYGDSNLYLKS